jgi:hypothetical protein
LAAHHLIVFEHQCGRYVRLPASIA